MTDAVSHRGPDGEGQLIDGSVALGHRRLSILDLTDHGAQPMSDSAARYSVVFNGEIYNYIEIRNELRSLGYSFRTDSDTEVLLSAYDKWGSSCVTKFNGMWAFAIYDRQERSIFLSRDRFGVKPLYYTKTEELFAFGSEIRQLLPFQPSITANMDIIHTYLITDAAELDNATFFEGIVRLPPGHNGTYNLADHRLSLQRYYNLTQDLEAGELSEQDAVDQFKALFEDAIKLRLRSDVKVGTCLSGGMDSSSVATVASSIYRAAAPGKFAAITAVSEQESNNEAQFAEMVVRSSDLDWYKVQPKYKEFVDSLDALVNSQEEPFGGPSLTMQYFVMKTARANGITVLLDGQGGDETLLGYEKYYASYLLSSFKNEGIPATLAALRATSRNNSKMGPTNIAKYFFGGLIAPARHQYYNYRHRHINDKPNSFSHLHQYASRSHDVFQLQKLEIESTNLPVLLRYEDKNSMAHGIEARLPFLDYRLLQFNLSISGRYKIRDGWTKWVLRKAMADRLPAEITWRKNKFGFEAPEDLWLRQHSGQMLDIVQASPLLNSLSSKEALTQAMQRLDKRSRWRLYSLALWERAFKVTR